MRSPSNRIKYLVSLTLGLCGLMSWVDLPIYPWSRAAPSAIFTTATTSDCLPGLGGQLFSKGGEVVVEILPASADITSVILLLSPGSPRVIATSRDVGKVVSLGEFPFGAELVFEIFVPATGQYFRTGPAFGNPDSLEHAIVECLSPDTAKVSFEDTLGGGDRDFNDVVFRVTRNAAKCHPICFLSPQFFLLHLNQLPSGAVVIGGVNVNNPISTGNVTAIHLALQGGATPLRRLNQQFVAAQLSVESAGGLPAAQSALWSPLSCFGLDFVPVVLSNGFILAPDSMLKDLFAQARFAIGDNRTPDMLALARLFDLLNGTDLAPPLFDCNRKPGGSLLIAFPIGNAELRLVFSEPVDRASAERPESYISDRGLKILAASVDPNDPKRVTLTTEPMDGESLTVDILRAIGVRTASGAPLATVGTLGGLLAKNDSPPFIQGFPDVDKVQKPAGESFPFASRFVGRVASLVYNKDGGQDGLRQIPTLGFGFLHGQEPEPFDSIKIVTNKLIPRLAEAEAQLQPDQSLNVQWAGGQIRNVDGENQLVDTGFMEGSILKILPSPAPLPIKTAEISQQAGKTLRAKSLQGVIVRFDNVTIDSVSVPDERRLRSIVFHDDSGALASGLLLHSVTKPIQVGQRFRSVRGIVHQPRAAQYEVIVELDRHLVPIIP